MSMRTRLAAVLASVLLAAPVVAQASDTTIDWTFTGTVAGTLTYDVTTSAVTAYDLSVGALSGGQFCAQTGSWGCGNDAMLYFAPHEYTNANSTSTYVSDLLQLSGGQLSVYGGSSFLSDAVSKNYSITEAQFGLTVTGILGDAYHMVSNAGSMSGVETFAPGGLGGSGTGGESCSGGTCTFTFDVPEPTLGGILALGLGGLWLTRGRRRTGDLVRA